MPSMIVVRSLLIFISNHILKRLFTRPDRQSNQVGSEIRKSILPASPMSTFDPSTTTGDPGPQEMYRNRPTKQVGKNTTRCNDQAAETYAIRSGAWTCVFHVCTTRYSMLRWNSLGDRCRRREIGGRQMSRDHCRGWL